MGICDRTSETSNYGIKVLVVRGDRRDGDNHGETLLDDAFKAICNKVVSIDITKVTGSATWTTPGNQNTKVPIHKINKLNIGINV
jgi:hypothetical protein